MIDTVPFMLSTLSITLRSVVSALQAKEVPANIKVRVSIWKRVLDKEVNYRRDVKSCISYRYNV